MKTIHRLKTRYATNTYGNDPTIGEAFFETKEDAEKAFDAEMSITRDQPDTVEIVIELEEFTVYTPEEFAEATTALIREQALRRLSDPQKRALGLNDV